jgi:hypothetical protein
VLSLSPHPSPFYNVKLKLPLSKFLPKRSLLPPGLASLLLSLSVAIAGCHSTIQAPFAPPAAAKPMSSHKAPSMHSSTRFQVLDFGPTPLEERFEPKPNVFVFQDQETWGKFWQRTTRLDANLQKPPAPTVDFTHQTIIGLTTGSHATGGYSVQVDGLELSKGSEGDRWIVHYSEIVPDKNCLVTQQPSTPTVFIAMQKTLLPIEFKGQQIDSTC